MLKSDIPGTASCSEQKDLAREQLAYEKRFYSTNSWSSRSVQIKRYLTFVEISLNLVSLVAPGAPVPCSSK